MLLVQFILKRFISFLLVLLFGLTGLYLLIDAFEHMDEFIRAGMSVPVIGAYFLFSSAQVLYELSPLIILLSGLLTLVTMGKSKELLALRAVGIRPKRIFFPLLAACLLLSLCFSSFRLLVLPGINEKRDEIVSVWLSKEPSKGTIHEGRLFYKTEHGILSGRIILPDASELADLEWFFYDGNFDLTRLIAASQARFVDGAWHLVEGVDYVEGKRPDFFTTKVVGMGLTPKDLIAVETPAARARPDRLFHAIKRLKALGLPAHEQETELLSQIFYSFLGVTLLFAALPVVFYRVHGGPAVGLSLGTALGFVVWSLWNFFATLGKTGHIPPPLAVAVPHLLLVFSGVYFSRRFRL